MHAGVCGMNMGMRSKLDKWWWNEEVNVATSRKKEAHKAKQY